MPKLKKWLPLCLLSLLLSSFFYFRLYHYFSFESLQQHHLLLLQWKEENYFLTVALYLACYTLAVAASFPVALIFSLIGGFLFGSFPGSIYVLFSATLGGTLLFLAVKLALADWAAEKASARIKEMERGFKENAFSYLLALRLIPLFPFWLINITAGLIDVRLSTFILATVLGLIPGTLIYTSLGKNLASLFAAQQAPTLALFFQVRFFIPLLILTILATLPIAYHYFKQKTKCYTKTKSLG